VLGGRAPTLEDMPRLAFTKAVALEAMRLYPLAHIIGRQVQAPLALGISAGSGRGCSISRGSSRPRSRSARATAGTRR
jgi:hypothetical protein